MKKIINLPENLVQEMCRGMVLTHPELELLPKYKVLMRARLNPEKVTLISGGGSGHEPAHAGFVGKGMLDAAVCGDVFASPSQIQIYQAICATAGKKGTLLIIKNYSGDMMNFKNAAFMAQEDGILIDYVRVDDDIAVQDSLYTVGRRGVAGTMLVHKIAGAMAERGGSLNEVKSAAEDAAANIKSIGFALTSCTVPAAGVPTFSLAEDEMEYGVGIHGEPGIHREKIAMANELAQRMIPALLAELKLPQQNAEVAVLINGFGATPLQELYVLSYDVLREISQRNITVARAFVGNYVTSIDMAGASITIMALNHDRKSLLDDACDSPALIINAGKQLTWNNFDDSPINSRVDNLFEVNYDWGFLAKDRITRNNMIYIIYQMSRCVLENEVHFCEMDSFAGDGDFGMSLAKGFRQLLSDLQEIIATMDTIGSFLQACSLVIMEHCGGASGPIWGAGFRAAAKEAGEKRELKVSDMADLLLAAVRGIQLTGERTFGRGAKVGDKTLIDALIPCANAWSESALAGDSVKAAMNKGALAAVQGAQATEKIVARLGRAGTVGERSLGFPDAGAYGLSVILSFIAKSMR